MNLASLYPWFGDYQTAQFSDGSACYLVLRSGCNSSYGCARTWSMPVYVSILTRSLDICSFFIHCNIFYFYMELLEPLNLMYISFCFTFFFLFCFFYSFCLALDLLKNNFVLNFFPVSLKFIYIFYCLFGYPRNYPCFLFFRSMNKL